MEALQKEKDQINAQLAATAKQFDDDFSKLFVEKEKLTKELVEVQKEFAELQAKYGDTTQERINLETEMKKIAQVCGLLSSLF